jgi:hypothetical protein
MVSPAKIMGVATSISRRKPGKLGKKTSSKMTAQERGFSKDKASRKSMKQQDVYFNKLGKQDLKSGKSTDVAKANTPKSNSKALKPKVPVKKKK